jgi:hypothetical protein
VTARYRLLVTGSRNCDDVQARFVRAILSRIYMWQGVQHGRDLTIVEGECPYGGVDLVARRWAEELGDVEIDAHPAEVHNGRVLGPARNARMVATGPDLCVGFPGPKSNGTWDCIRKAADAGIFVRVYPLPIVGQTQGLAALDATFPAGGIL